MTLSTSFKQVATTAMKGKSIGRANAGSVDLVEDPSGSQSHFFVMATGQVEWGEFYGR